MLFLFFLSGVIILIMPIRGGKSAGTFLPNGVLMAQYLGSFLACVEAVGEGGEGGDGLLLTN